MPRKILPMIALGLALMLAPRGAVAQGRWTAATPIPQGANEVIGAAVGGKLYLYGGQTSQGPLGIFWSYDPKTAAWTKLKSNPVAVHHAAAAAVGDKFYVFGGFAVPPAGKGGWYPEDKAWAYDTKAQSWSALPPMPTPRGALAATAVGDKIYVVGGAKIPSGMSLPNGLTPGGPVEMLGTLEVFDTTTNRWASLKPMSLPRNHHGVAALAGKLYVMGGRVGSPFSGGWSVNVSTTEIYDIASGAWSTGTPMPTARSGVGVAALAGRIYVLGGEGWLGNFGGVFRSNQAYDPNTNSWAEETRMPTPRHGFAVAVIDGKLYAVSGVNNAGGAGPLSVLDVNEVYTP